MSNDKKVKRGSLKNKKQFKMFCLVVALLLGFTSILFDAFILYADVLPTKYLLPALIISNLFVFLFIYLLIKRKFKLWIKFISIFFSFLFIIVYIVGCFYINRAFDFMGKIKSKNTITEEYYVMVNKDSEFNDIKDLNNKAIDTFDEGVAVYNEAISKLNEVGKFDLKKTDSIEEMIINLQNEEIDAIIISAVHKNMIAEENQEFTESTKIIYTISVEVEHKTEIKKPEVSVTKDAFTIYISGIDSYGSISSRSRSDVNMLVTVNPITHQILLTSIPRDYYVQLHDTTGYKDKLTHAGMYGVDMSMKTLEDLLDIKVDYYIRVNFSTLVDVVDTLGGIDVYSDKSFKPLHGKCYITQGMNHFDGDCALGFVRERYAYTTGDRHRVKNQQDVIAAIIKKATSSMDILTKYTTLLDQLSASFETNIESKDITSLIKMQLDKMPSWEILNYSLNGSDALDCTYSYGSQKLYVMVPYQDTIDKAHDYITNVVKGKKITIEG